MQEARQLFLAAQLEGNGRRAVGVIDGLLEEGWSTAELRRELVQWGQREIGRLWQVDHISVAREHAATAVAHLVLAHLFNRATPAPGAGRRVVVACVPGELHEFPARLLADALDEAGYETRFLGANVPREALIDEIRRDTPDALALSATMHFNQASLRDVVRAVRGTCPGLLIAVGGFAVDEDASCWRELGVGIVAREAEALVGALPTRLGRAA